jgi:hypothetical protein
MVAVIERVVTVLHRGIVCATKRANVIEATDQRTTSGPADSILRARGRRHDRTHHQRIAEK